MDPKIHRIVVDSFSAYMDMVLLHCRATQKGWDVWNCFNTQIDLPLL